MPQSSRPTARDVAARAGVSVATVSYVVNGRDGRCTAQTRERVLAAARDLGYAPDHSARSLRRRRTERVCLVVGSIGVPAYDRLARDLHVAAERAGYGVITLVVDSAARARQARDLLQQGIADGAVVSVPGCHLADIGVAALVRNRMSLVVLDNAAAPLGFDVVRTPERRACGEALDHLFGTGRRRVAYLGHAGDFGAPAGTGVGRHAEAEAADACGDQEADARGDRPAADARGDRETADARGDRPAADARGDRRSERFEAYLDALARHGVGRDDRLVVTGADDRVSGYRAVSALLRLADRPDAVFAASDRAAVSAIWAVRDAGLAVPGDVAVLGVGNLDEGLITQPALSTVGQPHLDYSGVVRLLFERMAAGEPLPPRELLLPWDFICRGSI
jgi:DNA-binding LacI/PurR family transcriptional regulator